MPCPPYCSAIASAENVRSGASPRPRKLRKKFVDALRAVRIAHIKSGSSDPGMAHQYSRELEAGVAGHSHDRDVV